MNGYFLEHSRSKDRFQWDVSTSRVFVSHKQQLFVTDEDPRGQNVSLTSVYATWMVKKVSVQFNAVAWASTTSSRSYYRYACNNIIEDIISIIMLSVSEQWLEIEVYTYLCTYICSYCVGCHILHCARKIKSVSSAMWQALHNNRCRHCTRIYWTHYDLM